MFDKRLTRPHFKAAIFASYLDLLEKEYPSINIDRLIEKTGLSLAYLRDESHWVSVTFERRFMDLLVEETGDTEVHLKAGKLGMSRSGLGEGLYFLSANVIPLDTLYRSLPKLTSLFNKVITVDIAESKPGHFKFLFKPNLAELNEEEAETLLSNMPYIMENTAGYYGQLPTIKKLPPARMLITLTDPAKGIYSLEAEYFSRAQMMEVTSRILPLTVFVILTLALHFWGSLDYVSSALYSYGIIMTGVIAYLVLQNRSLRGISVKFEDSLYKLDTQNKDLYDTKNKLQRKLEESQAVNELVSHLIKAVMEDEVLEVGCQCLVDNLHYDRAFILLFDESTGRLKLAASKGLADELERGMKNLSLPAEIDDADPAKFTNVFRQRKPLLVKDVREHLTKLKDPTSTNVLRASGTRSFVAVPIFTQDKSLGILVADCVSRQKIMTEDDLRLISTAGQQIAIAIEQQRSKQQLVDSYQKEVELSESYSRFVPFETLKLLNYKSIFEVKIGDYLDTNVAIMFSDIRGFTTLCESMSPSDILKFLNSYYGRLSPIIKAHGGTIDKFMGDGVMAIFPNGAQAVAAAVDIQRTLFRYNLEHRVGAREAIRAGVGVAAGRVVFGPLGSDKRLELTAIADTVNVASRLDGLCRESGQNIMVTGIDERVLGLGDHLQLIHLQPLKVKGRAGDVHVIAINDKAFFDAIDESKLNEAQRLYVATERTARTQRANSGKAA